MGMGTGDDRGATSHAPRSDGGRVDDMVSLAGLKEKALLFLPSNSATRSLILAEKDTLPSGEALVKFEVFDRLLVNELKVQT